MTRKYLIDEKKGYRIHFQLNKTTKIRITFYRKKEMKKASYTILKLALFKSIILTIPIL